MQYNKILRERDRLAINVGDQQNENNWLKYARLKVCQIKKKLFADVQEER